MKDTKEIKEESQWDKRKIILFSIAVVVLLGTGYELRAMVLNINSQVPIDSRIKIQPGVKGASTQNQSPVQDFKQNVQSQISGLKNEAQNINLIDIASSSPQVQKVIRDLKTLQSYPSDQLKETCQKVCNGL